MNKKELVDNFVKKWDTIFIPFIPNAGIRSKLILNFHDECLKLLMQLIDLSQKEGEN